MSSVYQINKGINRSIEFKGLKAQYIWWLGGGVVGIFVLYAIMYFIGLSTYVCVGFAFLAGGGVFFGVFHLSDKYGEHGLMKMMAAGRIPSHLISRSRKKFIKTD